MSLDDELKICKQCEKPKLRKFFYRNVKAKDGRHTVCADCTCLNVKEKKSTRGDTTGMKDMIDLKTWKVLDDNWEPHTR